MTTQNSNWKETRNGWVKKDTSTTRGTPIDWERANWISRWVQEIRKDREERNKAKPK
jgi:hypothetical protein